MVPLHEYDTTDSSIDDVIFSHCSYEFDSVYELAEFTKLVKLRFAAGLCFCLFWFFYASHAAL